MSFLIALRLTRSYLPRPLLRDPIVQWPRTLPFHGSNTGSNPVRVATLILNDLQRVAPKTKVVSTPKFGEGFLLRARLD